MRKNTIIFSLAFIVLIALGILVNAGIRKEKVKIAEEKFTQQMFDLLPDVEANILEEVEVKDSKKETKIVRKFKVFNEKKLVGYIYIGETKGYQPGMQVAYGINIKDHKVNGVKIVQSQETPRFLEALETSNFYDQFNKLDLSKFNILLKRLTVADTTTGATPNGNNKGKTDVIAPATTNGIERLLLFVREAYAKDNIKFKMPTGLTFVSHDLDYENINQFKYVFKTTEKQIDVVVNKDYEIVSISDEDQRSAVLELLPRKKMLGWIDSETTEGTITTLVIRSQTYGTTQAITTVTIDNGAVTNVTLTYTEAQSYIDSPTYVGGNYNNAPDQLKNNDDIPAITGATDTYSGLASAQAILRKYLEVKYE